MNLSREVRSFGTCVMFGKLLEEVIPVPKQLTGGRLSHMVPG